MKIKKLFCLPLIVLLAGCSKEKPKKTTDNISNDPVFVEQGITIADKTKQSSIIQDFLTNFVETESKTGFDIELCIDANVNAENEFVFSANKFGFKLSFDAYIDEEDGTKDEASLSLETNGKINIGMIEGQKIDQVADYNNMKAYAYLTNSTAYFDLTNPTLNDFVLSLFAGDAKMSEIVSSYLKKVALNLPNDYLKEVNLSYLNEFADKAEELEEYKDQFLQFLTFEEISSGYRVSVSIEQIIEAVFLPETNNVNTKAAQENDELGLVESLITNFSGKFTIVLNKDFQLSKMLLTLGQKAPNDIYSYAVTLAISYRYGDDVNIAKPSDISEYEIVEL